MNRWIATSLLTIAVVFTARAQGVIPTPEQFFGFRIGSDNKLARWDRIVDYLRQVANGSDRVRFRELGRSTNDNPFISPEISSPDTLKNVDGVRFIRLTSQDVVRHDLVTRIVEAYDVRDKKAKA